MAVRSKNRSPAKPKKTVSRSSSDRGPVGRRPVEMKAANSRKDEPKTTAKTTAKVAAKAKGVKAAIQAIAAKVTAPKGKAQPAAKAETKAAPSKAAAPKAAIAKAAIAKAAIAKVAAKAQGSAPQKTTTGKAGRPARGSNASNSAAAAVERVTERLMGRVAATPLSDAVCREVACEGLGTSAGYCRLHYIKNWKKIKRKEVILKEGKLNQYIEELVAKYPEKYIEAIRLDLANDKEFAKVIVDLDLDENDEDFEGEGTAPDGDVGIDSLKREFEEDTDTF